VLFGLSLATPTIGAVFENVTLLESQAGLSNHFKKLRRRTEILLDALPVLVLSVDRHRNIRYANRAASTLFALPHGVGDIDQGAEWLERIHVNHRPQVYAAIPSVLEGGRGTWEEMVRVEDPDGNVHWLNTRMQPVADPVANETLIQVVAADVTDVHLARRAAHPRRVLLRHHHPRHGAGGAGDQPQQIAAAHEAPGQLAGRLDGNAARDGAAHHQALHALAGIVDCLIVGGGIANTFIAAAGHGVGKSLYEADMLDIARELATAKEGRAEIPVPSDVVVAEEFADVAGTTKVVGAVASDELILDIGPDTTAQFTSIIASAGTVIWNGPVGVFEFDSFGAGTEALAEAIAASDAFSVAGGGDTLAAIDKYGVADRISYISTGGGAFLEFVEGKKLPAVEILELRGQLP